MKRLAVFLFGVLALSGAASAAPQHPNFPHMQIQAQYAGPMQDTIIQRLRDPIDGTICYLYIPIIAQHSPTPTGFVQYGSNTIGSISCIPPH